MLTQIIFDSFLFWIFLLLIVASAIYITKSALRMHEYEKQVDRGWNDLITRADKIVNELREIKAQSDSKKIGRSKTK